MGRIMFIFGKMLGILHTAATQISANGSEAARIIVRAPRVEFRDSLVTKPTTRCLTNGGAESGVGRNLGRNRASQDPVGYARSIRCI